MNLSKLEKTINHKFKDQNLVKEAITHRSYLNENARWPLPHNERLEFLGDAVLELAVTEEIYHRYPEKSEGYLTLLRAALVNFQSLGEVAEELDLNDHILLSKGETRDNSRARQALLANAVESIIGAIYLDSDYETAKKFINKFILSKLNTVLKNGTYRDAKSLLQERIQAQKKVTPEYKIIDQTGPEHEKHFKVAVYLGKKLLATGEGYSKQEAEIDAASKALKK